MYTLPSANEHCQQGENQLHTTLLEPGSIVELHDCVLSVADTGKHQAMHRKNTLLQFLKPPKPTGLHPLMS